MKIIFIGSVIFSNILLEKLISKGIKIDGIISLSEYKNSFKSDFYDLAKTSMKYNISNLSLRNINTKKSTLWIKKKKPDLILCLGWSQIISKEILKIPKLGVIGFHPSQLPKNRGKHPIIWALVLGLSKTASTFFHMDNKIDNGKILSQKIIPIKKSDNATKLYFKIAKNAENQLFKLLIKFKKQTFSYIKNKKMKSNYWRSRTFKDGEINWTCSSNTIHNLVRSLTFPYPNAHFYYKGNIIKVKKTKLGKSKNNNVEPGKIISVKDKSYEIKCGNSSIHILDIHPKVKIKVGDYL